MIELSDRALEAISEHNERMAQRSREIAATLSEGFCPDCRSRLEPDAEYAGWCLSCDLFWRCSRSPEEPLFFNWSCTSGWFVRKERGCEP